MCVCVDLMYLLLLLSRHCCILSFHYILFLTYYSSFYANSFTTWFFTRFVYLLYFFHFWTWCIPEIDKKHLRTSAAPDRWRDTGKSLLTPAAPRLKCRRMYLGPYVASFRAEACLHIPFGLPSKLRASISTLRAPPKEQHTQDMHLAAQHCVYCVLCGEVCLWSSQATLCA